MKAATRQLCKEDGCFKEVSTVSRGVCHNHYVAHRRKGDLDTFAPIVYQSAICEWDGIVFPTIRNAHYCSDRCRDKAENARLHPRAHEACLQCGNSLDHRLSNSMYCSPKCGELYRNGQRAVERLERKADCACCGTHLPKYKRSYCSNACKILARRAIQYGMTLAALRKLLSDHPVCDICGTNDWGLHGPHIDHDHNCCLGQKSCGKCVRGILCSNHNIMIGNAADDIAILQKGIDYLTFWQNK